LTADQAMLGRILKQSHYGKKFKAGHTLYHPKERSR
jgi:hypothetical protein